MWWFVRDVVAGDEKTYTRPTFQRDVLALAGGTFSSPDNTTHWADVSTPTRKIFGTGTVSFVQNHPYGSLPWIASDWTGFDYDAMEVWNGGSGLGFDRFAEKSREAWRCGSPG